MAEQRKSFLFLSHDNKIGDAIVLTGLLAPIKARWPNARIGVVCGQSNAVVYRAHPLVDFLHVTRSRSLLARMLAGLSARCKAYGQLVHFGSDVDSRSLRTLVGLAGAAECVLFFEPVRPLAAQQQVLAGDWLQRHVSTRHLRYLQWLDIQPETYTYDLRLSPSDVLEAAQFLQNANNPMPNAQLVIACDASTDDKSLPVQWVIQCCDQLLARNPELHITLLCAGGQRRNNFEDALRTLSEKSPTTTSIRLLPIRETAGLALALIAKADLLLSADTFAVHAASAFNVPVLAVYPGGAPGLVTWAPRSNQFKQLTAQAGQPVETIEPNMASAVCSELLQQSRASKPLSP